MLATPADFDVIIVGAGISGIGMAVHLTKDCPGKSFAIVEARGASGGTWDLFRYPGVRSDSDMHTLGFVFEPWKHEKSIADAPAILEYLNEITDQYDLRSHMRFGQKVVSADWDRETARWTVTTEAADEYPIGANSPGATSRVPGPEIHTSATGWPPGGPT